MKKGSRSTQLNSKLYYSFALATFILPVHGKYDDGAADTTRLKNHRKLPPSDPCDPNPCQPPDAARCERLNGKEYECIPYTCPGAHEKWNYCDPAVPASTSGEVDGVVDILIVGAGTAAMGAGRFLERYNYMNRHTPGAAITYRILEADSRHTEANPFHGMGRAVAARVLPGAEGPSLLSR